MPSPTQHRHQHLTMTAPPHPSTTTSLKLSLTQPSLDSLTHLSTLLHLFHHRNKNQHRRSPWYRPFQLLRRLLHRLLPLYTALLSVPDSHTARHKKRTKTDRDTQASIKGILESAAETLAPRCQRAFTQLVAEQRFAAQGVFLVAALAEFARVVGVVAWFEQRAGRVGLAGGGGRLDGGEQGGVVEDVGEVVGREGSMMVTKRIIDDDESMSLLDLVRDDATPLDAELAPDPELALPPNATLPSDTERPAVLPKKRKNTEAKALKKKKKRNAIDELFSGL